jgi:hypothetical protein
MDDAEHEQSLRIADKTFQVVRKEVLVRDDHTCLGCGVTMRKYLEVHHIDDDHKNNDYANLATLCPVCHSCFHIGRAGIAEEGLLVWLPHVPQFRLNAFAYAVHVAMRSDDPTVKSLAVGVQKTILRTQDIVLERIGNTSPTTLANTLMSLGEKDYQNRNALLGGLRYYPIGSRKMTGGPHGTVDTWPQIIDALMDDGGTFRRGRWDSGAWVSHYNSERNRIFSETTLSVIDEAT